MNETADGRGQTAEKTRRVKGGGRRKVAACLLLSAVCSLLLLTACNTVGVSRTDEGFAEVSPMIANEMLLDTRSVVILDIRPPSQYRGPEGHIAGAINAPFDTIERQLPELLPYQNNTVIVYGENATDGALAAKLLTVAGFRNVVHVAGGIQAWIERGYRTVNAQ